MLLNMIIDYNNMPVGQSRKKFALMYLLNKLRTWWIFHFLFPWVKYHGFVRVMKNTRFARYNIQIGHNVQFGKECKIATNVHFGSNILMASRVCFVGKKDHVVDIPGQTIWNGECGNHGVTTIGDDVWLGHNVTIVGPVNIGAGSVVAAGAVVTHDIPECEIWGGVPAHKIKNRFETEEDKFKHLKYLESIASTSK